MSAALALAETPAVAQSLVSVTVARTLDAVLEVQAVRTLAFVGEQSCPFVEEFDGNDFSGATHLLARIGKEPVGAGRIRWFANFCKLERIAVRKEFRKQGVAEALWEAARDIAERKGFRRMLAYVEPELTAFWHRKAQATPRKDRPPIVFSDRLYVEILYPLSPPEDALTLNSPAMELLRPEGAWDGPGILDASAHRPANNATLRAGT